MRICIYAASSQHCDPQYHADARLLGATLAQAGHTLVYGGGAVGSMGALADGALGAGGEVIGIIPRFMVELEWGWPGLVEPPVEARPGRRPATDGPGWRLPPGTIAGRAGGFTMEFVETMRERKHRLLADADAVVALPGGCGTLEELFEAITLKRLGLYANPIVLLNTRDYWTPLVAFLQRRVIDEGFMNPEHAGAWSIAQRPGDVLTVIANTPKWNESARDYAALRPLP